MSIQNEIERLQIAKNAIISAIKEKGVDVPSGTSISLLAKYIASITTGSLVFLEDYLIPTTKWVSQTTSGHAYFSATFPITYEGEGTLEIISAESIVNDDIYTLVTEDSQNAVASWDTVFVDGTNLVVCVDKKPSVDINIRITYLVKE